MGKELRHEKQRLNDELWFSQFDKETIKGFRQYEKLQYKQLRSMEEGRGNTDS